MKIFKKVIRKIQFFHNQVILLPAYFRLAQQKKHQKEIFQKLKTKCTHYYNILSQKNISQFTTTPWENYNQKLEKIIFPNPKFSFLRNRIIRETMFVAAGGKWIGEEIKFLENSIPKETIKRILEEDYVGAPLLIHSSYFTSHNSIHHLYHLLRFQKETKKTNLEAMKTVVEWGGGYGNMAKLFKRIAPKVTYIIIDLPLLSCLQWVYLATIFGENEVHIIDSERKYIEKEKINLLPLSLLQSYQLNCDLFIAAWSLSESSKYAQDYVANSNFFGAKHLLLSYQESGPGFPNAGRLGEIAQSKGAKIFPIEFLPGSYYAFK